MKHWLYRETHHIAFQIANFSSLIWFENITCPEFLQKLTLFATLSDITAYKNISTLIFFYLYFSSKIIRKKVRWIHTKNLGISHGNMV